jgi:hypothetical protein
MLAWGRFEQIWEHCQTELLGKPLNFGDCLAYVVAGIPSLSSPEVRIEAERLDEIPIHYQILAAAGR